MPTLSGLLEAALYVADVRASADFYQRLFGFGVLLESERLIALDVVGKNVLLLFKKGATDEPFTMPGGTIPGHGASGRSHFAFSVSAAELPAWKNRFAEMGVPTEGTMIWEGGAESVYFRDPDGHLGELLTPGFWRTY